MLIFYKLQAGQPFPLYFHFAAILTLGAITTVTLAIKSYIDYKRIRAQFDLHFKESPMIQALSQEEINEMNLDEWERRNM